MVFPPSRIPDTTATLRPDSPTGAGPGGRVPLAVGIDIGGTKVAAGVVDGRGRILAELRRSTPGRDPRAVEQVIVELVGELAARHDIEAVGIGAAGWMDLAGARVVFSPHLAWRDEPLQATMESLLGRPVLITNDADAAAWAEWRFGAGRGHERLIMLTLGTGIGGALMIDGRVERGSFGMAGEFGHQIIMPGGHRCECGNRGCWEQYASGNALGREGRELAKKHSPMAAGLLDAVQGRHKDITGNVVTELALAGEATAMELVAEVGDWLGLGIANLSAALDPALFIIGGGLSAAGGLMLEPARRAYSRNLTGRGYRQEAVIAAAQLGPTAGLVGAADLARARLAAEAGPGQGA
ncbi:glucokinase [Arthrobacter stackebrandtii]|uniref:Glucokinase n=1 Tax=Arthrobacter stackebrandtii TaxID=272161 RepID=A0ABS4Z1R6_9MICC|nr:ROK family glucokinase [Arthrobacter stackebrandtii]MBP2414999.1 glucokinase [Arthrobacter stackebrandtii]PYH00847.1 glucokinase [Arthrobacter stackebrandtii]